MHAGAEAFSEGTLRWQTLTISVFIDAALQWHNSRILATQCQRCNSTL